MKSELNVAFVEELEVLEAVFCQDGEFTLRGINEKDGSCSYSIRTTMDNATHRTSASSPQPAITINFDIGPNYPVAVPSISLTADHINRRATDSMRRDLHEYANKNLLGEPMAMQIVEWVREHAHEYANEDQTMHLGQSQIEQTDELMISLLLLDHMRARNRYVRTLIGWCSELGIMGRIFFVDKLILILLEGFNKNNKEFLIRLKTQKVDVDSSGKSCKEKMMSVLSETPSRDRQQRFQSFEAQDLGGLAELQAAFEAANLLELYEQHIRPLYKHLSHPPVK